MTTKSVRVPSQFEPLFEKAEETVGGFFKDISNSPDKGEIRVNGDRYVLVRGQTLLAALLDRMESQFGEQVMRAFIYDLAKTIGRGDSQQFSKKLDLRDPIARLSAGPVHFAYTGWAFVDILPESAPAADDSYLLVYDHPNTIESEHYLSQGRKRKNPNCLFSAGYSAGWCSHAFGLDLEAQEIECVAKGDSRCRFVMAPPAALERRIAELTGENRASP